MINPCKDKELNGKQYRCFFELTLQVIGGKWKPIILYQLALAGIMRFGELRKSMAGVTERMLTKQLRELEADGLIHREIYREIPPRTEYSLTPLGVSLIPILTQMREWGVKYEDYLGSGADFCGAGYESRQPLDIAAMYRETL